MIESLTTILDALPYLLEGALVTIALVVLSMLLGLCLGLPLAVAQVFGNWPVRQLARTYIWFFRGVPILVLFFLFYFGLFTIFEVDLDAFSAACLVLGLTTGAYQSQIFRGAIQTIPPGQLKAARALGMTDSRAILTIVLPQALRLAIPGWSNEYSIILKDSAVAFALGTTEIMARTHFVASRTYQHLPLYCTAAVLYFILTWIGVRMLRKLEDRVRIKGYGTQGTH